MRWLAPMLWLGCGAPHVTPPPPAPVATAPTATPVPAVVLVAPAPVTPPVEPKAPPLPKLAEARSVFMIVTEQGKSRCQQWRVTPGEHSFLSWGGDSIGYENHGATLELKSRSRSHTRGGDSAYCSASFEVHEVDGGLDVGGARWFDRSEDCDHALARKERVAMDLSGCEIERAANLQEQAASQRTFEAMLRDGGTMYSFVDDDCVAVHAAPYKNGKRDRYKGDLWSAVRDGKRRGKLEYGYELTPNEMEIVILGPSTSWDDGEGWALGCGDVETITYHRDSVELGQRHYLSLASCRAEQANERERVSRLPKPADDGEPRVAGTSSPSLGGC
jgi:hypothetical protein